MYRVEVDYGSAYELIASLRAYVSTELRRVVDLDSDWRLQVLGQLSPDDHACLQPDATGVAIRLGTLVCRSPVREAEGYIDWLSGLSTEELYTIVATNGSSHGPVPPRDGFELAHRSSVAALSAWHSAYFRTVDPRILAGLLAEAEEKRASCASMEPQALVTWATGGVRVLERPGLDRVRLVPQYHARPWNIFTNLAGEMVIEYPAENIHVLGSDVPPKVSRLSKALSDENRLRILRYLASAPGSSFTDVFLQSGISKSTVHHHMMVLRAAGLISVILDAEGNTLYELRGDAREMIGSVFGEFVKA